MAYGDPLAKPKSPEARQHLERGNKLYTLREFDKAIEEYKAGLLVEDAPVFQYNLAQAYRLSGDYQQALWFYERFEKRTSPGGELKQAIDQFKAQMQSELDAAATKQAPTEPASGEDSPSHSSRRPHQMASARWYRDGVGWGLVGSGLVASAVAGYLFSSAAQTDRDALLEDMDKERTRLQSRASNKRIAGIVTAALALAGLGAGVVKLAIVPHDEATSVVVSIGGDY